MKRAADKELLDQLTREMQDFGPGLMARLELQGSSVLQVIAIMQLASRHPKIPPMQDQFIHKLVDILESQIPAHCVAMKKVIAMGWDKSFDA